LSLEEKRGKVLEIFYESSDVFLFKVCCADYGQRFEQLSPPSRRLADRAD